MSSIILTHLGESVPPYLRDCVHQLRLWNFTTPVYCILEPCHKGNAFWTDLEDTYGLILVYTDTLKPTGHHQIFCAGFKGDTKFRKGYWKHVKERFFYAEELMLREGLTDSVSMEYDILVYGSLDTLTRKLQTSHRTLRMVMDNPSRGHPGFLVIPNAAAMTHFNQFLIDILHTPLEDMQSLAMYSEQFPNRVHMLPVLTEQRNSSIPIRKTQVGEVYENPKFLSEDSEHFGCLFDSLVVGQWLGGIDPRNINGHKISRYENEGALYSIREMPFEWRRVENLWQPYLDGRPLMTIHCHSKALSCFLSDRNSMPTDDYNVEEVYKNLLPN